ncbi:MAG: hypothetical protein ACR2GR_01485 [Rhodothermales bacterium]
MRLFFGLFLSLLTLSSAAQPAPVQPGPPHRVGFVAGFAGSLLLAQGDFRQEIGTRQGGGDAFFGVRVSSRLAFGLDLAHHVLDQQSETVLLTSGPAVNLETTSAISRISVFGRYGPRLGRVQPYADVLVGANVLGTHTKIAGTDDDKPGKKQKESVTPALGGGLGMEVSLADLLSWPVAARVQARHVFGGAAEYLIYDEKQERFITRSSRTTTFSLSFGLTYDL